MSRRVNALVDNIKACACSDIPQPVRKMLEKFELKK
jgi:hypothetical protein